MNKKILIITMILILSVILIGCSSPGDDTEDPLEGSETNTIQGTVIDGSDLISGVEVTLEESNKTKITDSNGNYQFSDLDDGTYTLTFYKTDVIDPEETREVQVSGGKEVIANFDLSEDLTGLESAKYFVENLNNSGMQMKNTINNQMEDVETKMTDEVIPRLENLGQKVNYSIQFIQLVLGEHFPDSDVNYNDHKFSSTNDFTWLKPGTYTIDYSNDLPKIILDEENGGYNDSNKGIWNWEISRSSKEFKDVILVEIINPENVVDKENNIIYLYKAEFHYKHQLINKDTNEVVFEINGDFNITNENTKEIIVDNSDSPNTTLVFPEDGQIKMEGTMSDNLTSNDYEPLGEVSIKTTIENNVASNNEISFDGTFTSDFIESSGDFSIEFYSLPGDQDIISNSYTPKVKNINYQGDLTILETAKISGGLSVTLREEDQYPKTINLSGSFQDINSDGSYSFKLDGDLAIDPNYDNYDPSLEETSQDNYIAGKIDFEGSFEKDGFAPITLSTSTNREGYNETSSQLRFEFNDGSYIDAGQNKPGGIFTTENTTSIEAYNQSDLKFTLEIKGNNDYSTEKNVGNIVDVNNSETYADIILKEGQLTVRFADGEEMSLFY